jgi:hypothetical protein
LPRSDPQGTSIRVKKKARSRANSDDEVSSISLFYVIKLTLLF